MVTHGTHHNRAPIWQGSFCDGSFHVLKMLKILAAKIIILCQGKQ